MTDRQQLLADLAARHSRLLYRVAYSLAGNPQDAEDAVQDTFLKLLKLEILPDMQDERAYLSRAVWRAGLDRLTSTHATAMRHAQDVTELPLASPAPSPAAAAEASDDRALLRALIAALPADLRHPLVLCAVQDMSTRDVAATLGIPEATVRTRIHRAKVELRRRFEALSLPKQEAAR